MNKSVRFLTVLAVFVLLAAPIYSMTIEKLVEDLRDLQEAQKDKAGDIVMTMEGKVSSPQMGAEMQMEVKMYRKGDKFRNESTMKSMMGNMQTIILYDGKDTWMKNPMMGTKKMSDEQSLDEKEADSWFEKPITETNASYIGEEKFNGIDCYIVHVPEFDEKIWYAKDGLYDVKKESSDEDGRHVEVFSDFKEILKGYTMGHTIEVFQDGQKVSSLKITDVKTNANLDDSLFDGTKL